MYDILYWYYILYTYKDKTFKYSLDETSFTFYNVHVESIFKKERISLPMITHSRNAVKKPNTSNIQRTTHARNIK